MIRHKIAQSAGRIVVTFVVTVGIVLPRFEECRGAAPTDPPLALKPPLCALDTPEGRRLLIQSKAQEPFWALAQNFQCQPDNGSCSVASCIMVLNSLKVPSPESPEIHPFRRFTPTNFFDEKVVKVITRSRVSKGGMTLRQLHLVLEAFPVVTRIVYAGDSNVDTFRQALKESLATTDHQILVNYSRSVLGQQGGGHISPVAAYNEEADRVLIADSAGYKYPWTWIPVSDIWGAMARQKDWASGMTRGYIVVWRVQISAGTVLK